MSYETDTNDSVTMLLAYRADNGCDLFVVTIRGTFSAGEWASAFDLGKSGDVKGAAVASQRALDFIRAFIAENDDPAREDRILITGHSRGGCIAQLVGRELEKEGAVSFTYAFNGAPVTDDPAVTELKTIFNLRDSADFFPQMFAFGDEELYFCGRTLAFDVAGSPEALAALAVLKGRDDHTALTQEQLALFRGTFASRFATREALYDERTIEYTFATREEAQEKLDALAALEIADCAFSEPEESAQGFALTLTYRDTAVMSAFWKTLAYGAAARDAAVIVFEGDKDVCTLLSFIIDNAAAVSGGHLLVNDLVLTGLVK